jgi:hypothetical protein
MPVVLLQAISKYFCRVHGINPRAWARQETRGKWLDRQCAGSGRGDPPSSAGEEQQLVPRLVAGLYTDLKKL